MDELILTRKLKMWQNRLLDLSKRNRMISFRDSGNQVIRFTEPGFEELYQSLVLNGRGMQIRRAIDKNSEPTVFAMVRLMHYLSEHLDVSNGEIRTSGTLESSERTLRNIKKYTDLSQQEKGTNVLYLSFGFLYWKDRDTKGAWLKAPLVLVPAKLSRSSVSSPFKVQRTDEEIIVNPTFSYYMQVNYGSRLPELKSADSVQDLYTFFEQVSRTVEKYGWRVEREVYLSTMSFLKTSMYNDLVENEQRIMAHPVLRAFAGEKNPSVTLEEEAVDFRHDSTNIGSVYEVLNADSSQKDAVELSRRGISFVMQGPPGTGKSQTIANIIAQGIAEGRKILFVSEKQAALDVVYRRLQAVGIADLCLPLHDPKTGKQVLMKQLEQNLDAPKNTVGNERLAELHQLDGLKEKLNAYVHQLHETVQPLDLSLYEAYQMLFALADVPDVLLNLPGLASADRAEMNRLILEVSEYEQTRDVLGERWYAHPWAGIKKQNLPNAGKQRLREAAGTILKNLDVFCGFEIRDGKRLSDVVTLDTVGQYEAVGRKIAGLSVVPEQMVLDPESWDADVLPEETADEIRNLAAFYRIPEETLLEDVDRIRSRSLETADLFRQMTAVLSDAGDAAAQLSCLQVFQIRELMYQHGLNVRSLSVTEDYFSEEGLDRIARIRSERSEMFSRAEGIRMRMLRRYGEGVLNLRLDCTEEQFPELLVQIRHFGSGNGDPVTVLKQRYGFRLPDAADPEEVRSVVMVLLDGTFDRYAGLSENEFYFVYDLLEEARLKEEEGDRQWLSDYADMLVRYTGTGPETHEPGIWDRYLTLANDFYYVNNAYPDLLQIVRMSDEEKRDLRRLLVPCADDGSAAARIVQELQRFDLDRKKSANEVLCEDVRQIHEYQRIFREAEERYVADTAVIGNQYLMASTDWTLIERNISFAREAAGMFAETCPEGIRELLTHASAVDWDLLNEILAQLLEAGSEWPAFETMPVYLGEQTLQSTAARIAKAVDGSLAWKEVCDAAKEIRETVFRDSGLIIDRDVLSLMLDSDSGKLFDMLDLLCGLQAQQEDLMVFLDVFEEPDMLTELTVSDLRSRIRACLEQFSEYDTMADYRMCAERCRQDGLNAFISRAYQARTGEKQLGKMFEKAFLTAWIDLVSEQMEGIYSFSSRAQENRIAMFSELDTKQLSIAKDRVLSNSYRRMPSRGAGKVVGEMGTLLREISRSKNAMSVRRLFNSIPTLILKLKPCLMMSPLSVAYFLKADLYQFDTVIFDEASQIFPENAVGAILRGKQVIISGDSKQMPPTSFFRSAIGMQEEEPEEEDDLYSDSILEEAENALPNLSLTWHYRSRSESLITFSNRNMYAGSLVTFPNSAPNSPDTGVEYVYVEDGVYEDRRNMQEAEACVRLAAEHFRKHPERSLGIIAFSTTQEECIEDAFDAFRGSHPEYEEYFSENRPDPFFIKNLENVQGDERDTILLSVGYGKNAQGILRYNFGPLGAQGGERRMNVAITRARYDIKLVTSLRPEDFDKEKTEAIAGAKLLYDYISYARNGPEPAVRNVSAAAEDGFRQYIVRTLEEAGYRTAYDVGNSGYRMEIAVEDPESPGSYITGIETDGPVYERGRTVRDRDCLRPGMLRSMGWNLYRVWSTQWIRDPETEKRKLLEYVAKKAAEAAAAREPAPDTAEEDPQENTPPETADTKASNGPAPEETAGTGPDGEDNGP